MLKIFNLSLDALHFGNACFLTAFQPIVVEPSAIRSLAADYPIHNIFKPSHLAVFHAYVVVVWL
jgi:hypothetical protein